MNRSAPTGYHSTRWQWLGRHLLFWTAYFLFIPYQTYLYGSTAGYNLQISAGWLPFTLVNVYIFLYGILPFLLNDQRRLGWLLVAGWWIANWQGVHLYYSYVLLPLRPDQPTTTYQYSMAMALINGSVTGIAVCLKLGRQWYQKDSVNQQLMQASGVAELQLLKAQIHPHFLFNTLNNLYSLTLKQSDHAPEVVLKLSEVLHYMLHECTMSQVSIQKEMQVIGSYIELEKLRYGTRLQIDVRVNGEIADRTMPPLLLIPFVENAFKHGSAEQAGQAYIHIQIDIVGESLRFVVINSKSEEVLKKANFGGIGLANVKKRLQLLYPHQHQLTIRPEKSTYEICMTIPLQAAPVLTETNPVRV